MQHIKKFIVLLPVAILAIGLFTAVMTSVTILPDQAFMPMWLRALTFAILLMLPLGVIFYLVNKVVQRLFGSFSVIQRNLIHGLCMAFIMETILALVTTFNNLGWPSFDVFVKEASLSLVTALPIGIAMACLMSLVVKPRLEAHFSSNVPGSTA